MTTIMSDVIAGRIALLDPLARGASGSLWRAVDLRYDAVCAAKVMRQRDGAEVLRFVREQAAGGLDAHPHLLPPYTWVAEDDTIVLVMPLVHGGTLADALVEQGALSPSLVAQLLRQLLDALAAMHAERWVHRDVKPANLLLADTGPEAPHLLLADFGIALHESDLRLTETGAVHGTPGFMAPEVRAGEASSAAQDVWAAGACALEALDPRPSRERPDPAAALPRLERALRGSTDPSAAGLGSLLRALLAVDPGRRPTAAAARAAIPAPGAHAAHWSHTAAGARFAVPDRVRSEDGRREVPLEGPAALVGVAPGLHERLTARSAGQAPVGQPSPVPPGAQAPSDPSDRTVTTERHVPLPTRRAVLGPSPVPVGTPAATATPDTAPVPAPRARGRIALGAFLLVLSPLCLLGAAVLGWSALG
jgi:serine/threonine-protein kinase